MNKIRSRYSFHGGVASIAGAQPTSNNNTRDVAPQTVWTVDPSLLDNFHISSEEVQQEVNDVDRSHEMETLIEEVNLKEDNNEINNELHRLPSNENGQVPEVKRSRK